MRGRDSGAKFGRYNQLRFTKSACASLIAITISPPNMRTRACTGISVLIALFAALMLASAPRLHDQLHPTGAQHQCAATILASGNCQHTAAQQIVPAPQKAPKSPAFLPKSFQFLVAAIPSSIQEHAPPTSR